MVITDAASFLDYLSRIRGRTLAVAGAKVACVDVMPEALAETVAAISTAGGTNRSPFLIASGIPMRPYRNMNDSRMP